MPQTERVPLLYREKRLRKQFFDLLKSVYETEYVNVKRPINPSTKQPIEPAHRFEVVTEPDTFTQEKFDVFLKYQTTIHQEAPSKWSHASFKRFLCTGLKRSTYKETEVPGERKLGSYHQCYRLDGKLIAVAVLDLLPHAVSSVYIFYDPSFGEFEFGKISAMREIALTQEEGYLLYYMGFYIHSCPKMRYKASFRPQFLLDPESLEWNVLDENLSRKLDSRRYVSLAHDRASGEDGTTGEAKSESSVAPSSGVADEDRSLFDVGMPGVLTRQQLQSQVDLDSWRLLIRGMIVSMEDLVSWEESDIMNPHSLKGIVGELAAVLGPRVVRESAVMLF
ncbi:Arginyl-tRNA--protein transferase 1 [Arachnomyces sp. PD_36]|nr:Arginyl-tRNA--protein transferase 1 [Arachnomyces sp. PD_36]